MAKPDLQKRTLLNEIKFSGIGVHSGRMCQMCLIPAKSGGIRFLRDNVEIPATIDYLQKADYCLQFSKDKITVQTAEHLLAALSCNRITDLIIKLDENELPILDGSALPYVSAIKKTGTKKLAGLRPKLELSHKIEVSIGQRYMSIEPADEFSIELEINYPHKLIGRGKIFYPASLDFNSQIAPARTFGFLNDEKLMRKLGLIKGVSHNNTLIFDEHDLIKGQSLRFENEPLYHKLLDLLGDLSLLPYVLCGHIKSYMGGHQLSGMLMRKIVSIL